MLCPASRRLYAVRLTPVTAQETHHDENDEGAINPGRYPDDDSETSDEESESDRERSRAWSKGKGASRTATKPRSVRVFLSRCLLID